MRLAAVLNNKLGLLGVLGIVFVANAVATKFDPTADGDPFFAGRICRAFHQFEGGFSVHGHDHISAISVYGYSFAYLVAYGILMLSMTLALLQRPGAGAFRVFVIAILADWVISLPFFLFFPVKERWTYVESGAVLLMDLWSPKLIELIRPFSGLDNCVPSFHASSTTIAVLCAYLYQVRFRTTALVIGVIIVLSTLVLGIHWIVDAFTGLSLGVISVAIGARVDCGLRQGVPKVAPAAVAAPPAVEVVRLAPEPQPVTHPVMSLMDSPKVEPSTAKHERAPQRVAPDDSLPGVFVCYSRHDQALCDEFLKFMYSFERNNVFRIWRDKEGIAVGADWEKEIDKALSHSEIGILMISQDFLNSSFILERELPLLVAAAERNSITLACVFLTHSTVDDIEIRYADAAGAPSCVKLTKYQGCHAANDPVAVHPDAHRERSSAERAELFASISQKIAHMARTLGAAGLRRRTAERVDHAKEAGAQ